MITVEQARKTFDEETNKRLGDSDIQSIIDDLRVIAEIATDEYFESKKVKTTTIN